jgi:hypothetical protein
MAVIKPPSSGQISISPVRPGCDELTHLTEKRRTKKTPGNWGIIRLVTVGA